MPARLLSILMAGGLFAAQPAGPELASADDVAVREWAKGATLPPEARKADAEGIRLLLEGRYQEAAEAFDRSLKTRRKNPRALANRGVALLRLGRLDEAIKDFEAALGLAPELKIPLRARLVEARVARGRLNLSGDRVTEALEDFYSAIRASREDGRGYAAVAAAARKTRELETCVSYAGRALELGPVTVEALETRAACLAELARRDDAIKDLGRAIELASDRAELWALRAGLELQLGRRSAARRDAKRALELDPGLADRLAPALR